MLLGIILPSLPANAATKKIANLTGDLTVREEPNTNGKFLGYVYKGETYTILDEAWDNRTPPVKWYKLDLNGKSGWVSSLYVTVTEVQDNPAPTPTPDPDFETSLQAFPETYREPLRNLHALYPNWKFEVQNTGLDWNTVIQEEYKLGRNLVYKTSITSWKSTQQGAYNWETGKWIGLDGDSWHAASKGIIEHFMDPRNFLDKTNIFQFLKQSYNAGSLNEEQLAKKKAELTLMVQGTFLAGTYVEGDKTVAYVDTIMEAGKQSGVCPLTLASMIIQEQGVNGTGRCISGTVSGYEGYYNFFNVGAYASGSMSAVQRGLWYASGSGSNATSYNRPWNTRTASIIGGAMYYGKNYVSVGQDTMYLKKYNVQGSNIYNHQYMTNVEGAASEGKHIADGYNETSRTAALVFKIPVFKNMPGTPPVKPTGNKNPNYMLKSIGISGYSLTPTFNIYETNYAITVPYGISNVKIDAMPVASTTTVSGAGNQELKVGNNVFTITSTAENGEARTYTLTVVRQAEAVVGKVSVASTTFVLNTNSTITGIKTFPLKAVDFLGNLSVTNGSASIANADGTEVTGNVGTGDQVKVYDSNRVCQYTYNVVIYGDANGDGIINAKDLLVIQKNNIKVKELEGVYLTSADVNRDGRVNAKDLLLVQKNNIKISSIEQ